MDFNSNKAIYLQIAEYVCEHILLEKWKQEDKVPSVRDMAVKLEVNPNTVARTYDLLQQKGILANKRGVGFFLGADAVKQVKDYRKSIFINEELPNVFRNIYLLDIGLEELTQMYKSFVGEHFNNR
ncbi:GntR family transcriptional regulator [Sphingobacterium sp. SYP-B4668]|uniref:GntR family transcriptional regulator n=1 Tax=Sphingobacterium sp. SYP-B4668 TaxID=2996035 RepID=UPI0005326807|nr:GntR family transcriptional regulator [Sphingobacterium sp. SYP-B4668]